VRAALERTVDVHLAGLDLAAQVGVDALGVEDVPALEDAEAAAVDFAAADGALPALRLHLLRCHPVGLLLLLQHALQGFLAVPQLFLR
jgi:hypothetical protein